LNREREEIERQRELTAVRPFDGPVAASPAPTQFDAAVAADGPEQLPAAEDEPNAAVKPDRQAERLERLFRPAPKPAPVPDIPVRAAEPPPAAPAPEDYHLNDVDSDSISDYMQKLLARSRQNRGAGVEQDDDSPPQRSSAAIAPQYTSRSSAPGFASEPRPDEDNVPAESDAAAEVEAPAPLVTRPRHNANELRAGISSMRQIANLSARSAVAKHSWKMYRRTLFAGAVLTVVSFATAVASLFLFANGSPESARTSYGAFAIAILSAFNLVRTWYRAHRAQSVKSSDVADGAEVDGDTGGQAPDETDAKAG
jgi:hypothetical protein